MPNNDTTSLWKIIESMQQTLEGDGLDHELADIVVTRGLVSLLEHPDDRLDG